MKRLACLLLPLVIAACGDGSQKPGAMTSAEINDWVADRCGL